MSRTLEQVLADDFTGMDDYKAHLAYDEFLDDAYGDVEIGSMSYSTSSVLKQVDEVAYRIGFNDWTDSDYHEVGGNYYTTSDVEAAQEIVDQEAEEEEAEEEDA